MKKFLLVDLTGRGYTCEYEEDELPKLEKYLTGEVEENEESVTDWAEFAESGEEYIDRTFKIICI